MTLEPIFPPLLTGVACEPGIDPFDKALMLAARGCDAGTITYSITENLLAAGFVFAPDVELSKSLAMLPLCGVGFQNALGALAPPEVAVHLEWSGQIRINAAKCGNLQVAASGKQSNEIPDWLVVGLTVPLWMDNDAPGKTPDATSLFEEGCADVEPLRLLESWARHCLVWINTWEAQGAEPLHREWRGLAFNIGSDITHKGVHGNFMGVDENFGLLLRAADTTHLFPLTDLLKDTK